jgi:hypothetical protein
MFDQTALKSIVKGCLTFVPGWQWIMKKEGGGSNSARYCYAVWLRHLSVAVKCGAPLHPGTVAELGPGDSIGTGLAAILSGCKAYLAFDIVPFTALEKNLDMLDELVALFGNRTPIPDQTEFPDLYPRLDQYAFPIELFQGDQIEKTLGEGRIRAVRDILLKGKPRTNGGMDIRYVAPWNSTSVIEVGAIDMIFSQAVMEHVDDLQSAYAAMHQWLKPGGVMSHEIDFKCHGTARYWDGHRTYPDPVWRIIRGRRPYHLNRQTCGHHLELMRQAGFEIAHISRQGKKQSFHRTALCSTLRDAADVDLCTSSAHIIAFKK